MPVFLLFLCLTVLPCHLLYYYCYYSSSLPSFFPLPPPPLNTIGCWLPSTGYSSTHYLFYLMPHHIPLCPYSFCLYLHLSSITHYYIYFTTCNLLLLPQWIPPFPFVHTTHFTVFVPCYTLTTLYTVILTDSVFVPTTPYIVCLLFFVITCIPLLDYYYTSLRFGTSPLRLLPTTIPLTSRCPQFLPVLFFCSPLNFSFSSVQYIAITTCAWVLLVSCGFFLYYHCWTHLLFLFYLTFLVPDSLIILNALPYPTPLPPHTLL